MSRSNTRFVPDDPKINNICQILKAFKQANCAYNQCTKISRLFLRASFRVSFYSIFVEHALAALFGVAAFAVYVRASVPSAFPRTFLKFTVIKWFFGFRVFIAVGLLLRFVAGGLHFAIFFMENWTCPDCGKLSPVSFDFAITDWSPRYWKFSSVKIFFAFAFPFLGQRGDLVYNLIRTAEKSEWN